MELKEQPKPLIDSKQPKTPPSLWANSVTGDRIVPDKNKTITVKNRTLQGEEYRLPSQDPLTIITAHPAVRTGLQALHPYLKGRLINIGNPPNITQIKYPENFEDVTPAHLQLISRNETVNGDGAIKFEQFGDLPRPVVLALKKLVVLSHISNQSWAEGYGGYPEKNSHTPFTEPVTLPDGKQGTKSSPKRVIVHDWAGPQQQTPGNDANLFHFTAKEDPWTRSALDNFLRNNLANVSANHGTRFKVLTFSQCANIHLSASQPKEEKKNPKSSISFTLDSKEKTVSPIQPIKVKGKETINEYVDTRLYSTHIANALVAGAIHTSTTALMNNMQNPGVNYAFLNAGMGFFMNPMNFKDSENRKAQLYTIYTPAYFNGLYQGLEQLVTKHKANISPIKKLSFPFSDAVWEKPLQEHLDSLQNQLDSLQRQQVRNQETTKQNLMKAWNELEGLRQTKKLADEKTHGKFNKDIRSKIEHIKSLKDLINTQKEKTPEQVKLEKEIEDTRKAMSDCRAYCASFQKKALDLLTKNGIQCSFEGRDALRGGSDLLTGRPFDGLHKGTSNTADGHVRTGNEMGYGHSVDAAIGQNLWDRANAFCPNFNQKMQSFFLDYNDPTAVKKFQSEMVTFANAIRDAQYAFFQKFRTEQRNNLATWERNRVNFRIAIGVDAVLTVATIGGLWGWKAATSNLEGTDLLTPIVPTSVAVVLLAALVFAAVYYTRNMRPNSDPSLEQMANINNKANLHENWLKFLDSPSFLRQMQNDPIYKQQEEQAVQNLSVALLTPKQPIDEEALDEISDEEEEIFPVNDLKSARKEVYDTVRTWHYANIQEKKEAYIQANESFQSAAKRLSQAKQQDIQTRRNLEHTPADEKVQKARKEAQIDLPKKQQAQEKANSEKEKALSALRDAIRADYLEVVRHDVESDQQRTSPNAVVSVEDMLVIKRKEHQDKKQQQPQSFDAHVESMVEQTLAASIKLKEEKKKPQPPAPKGQPNTTQVTGTTPPLSNSPVSSAPLTVTRPSVSTTINTTTTENSRISISTVVSSTTDSRNSVSSLNNSTASTGSSPNPNENKSTSSTAPTSEPSKDEPKEKKVRVPDEDELDPKIYSGPYIEEDEEEEDEQFEQKTRSIITPEPTLDSVVNDLKKVLASSEYLGSDPKFLELTQLLTFVRTEEDGDLDLIGEGDNNDNENNNNRDIPSPTTSVTSQTNLKNEQEEEQVEEQKEILTDGKMRRNSSSTILNSLQNSGFGEIVGSDNAPSRVVLVMDDANSQPHSAISPAVGNNVGFFPAPTATIPNNAADAEVNDNSATPTTTSTT